MKQLKFYPLQLFGSVLGPAKQLIVISIYPPWSALPPDRLDLVFSPALASPHPFHPDYAANQTLGYFKVRENDQFTLGST